MKKILFIMLTGVMLTSCKKEYTCECNFYLGQGGGTSTNQYVIKHKTKAEAITKCDDGDMVAASQNMSYATCNIQ